MTFDGFQREPYPDRNTAVDQFIITKRAGAGSVNTGNVATAASGAYAGYGKMEFDTSINIEPPSYDPQGLSLTGTAAHEIGHTFNLGDCYYCSNTVMCSACGIYGPTTCDNCYANAYNSFPPT